MKLCTCIFVTRWPFRIGIHVVRSFETGNVYPFVSNVKQAVHQRHFGETPIENRVRVSTRSISLHVVGSILDPVHRNDSLGVVTNDTSC
jgi:hypothetical protein